MHFILGEATADFLPDSAVDVIVTSPPYWQKRKYGLPNELGQEVRKEDYIARLVSICAEWKRILKPTGSIFVNIDDTLRNGEWQLIPQMFSKGCKKHYHLIHQIIWAKTRGMPSPAKDRLTHRSEDVFHFAPSLDPYLDFDKFADRYPDCGTVWTVDVERTGGDHIAPFPLELVERCAALALPPGGVLYDPFCGSGTVFRLELTEPGITTIGSDLQVYERARDILTAPAQYPLF